MARQKGLFPEPAQVISVDSSRSEPLLWVRRLVLWAQPGDIVRDIPLRRGLNVIWSPDPGSEAAILGQNSESGHGAGKTLFCRLLRYCLGESTFSGGELRRNIVGKFPNGLVGAEVVISGTLWAVIRPIGQTRRHLVRQDATLEQLIESKDPATGISPLLDALSGVVQPPSLATVVPELRDPSTWLFALAWLARDQECRFDHILDWRHARSESESPVSAISKDQVVAGVRSLFGILDDEEIRLKNERNLVPARRQSRERDLTYSRRRLDELHAKLMKEFEIEQQDSLGGTLDLVTLRTAAQERVRAQEQKSSVRPFAAQIATLREERDGVLQQIAVLQSQLDDLQAKVNLFTEEMKAQRGERANLEADAMRATLGDFCPVCRVPIDLALAEGCALAIRTRSPQSVQEEKADLAARSQACNAAIVRYQAETSEKKRHLSELYNREGALNKEISDLESRADRQLREERLQWVSLRRLQDEVSEFAELQDELSRAQQDISTLDRRDQDLRDQQSALRDRHSDVLRRLNDLFVFVSRGLLGSKVESSIDLTGQGLHAKVQVGGQAMESLKAMAFDLATMLMSMEGRAGLPAFLVHDSPREADLGQSIYDRVFRLAATLECISSQPAFQYIITTTSDPPAEFRDAPYVITRLSGSRVEERLLRCHLD